MRFRVEELAFMGGIEAMFCQVKFSDSQRSFLRYLWCNNNDLHGELIDYRIGVHVFGGTFLQDVAIMHREEQLLTMHQTMTQKLLRHY